MLEVYRRDSFYRTMAHSHGTASSSSVDNDISHATFAVSIARLSITVPSGVGTVSTAAQVLTLLTFDVLT